MASRIVSMLSDGVVADTSTESVGLAVMGSNDNVGRIFLSRSIKEVKKDLRLSKDKIAEVVFLQKSSIVRIPSKSMYSNLNFRMLRTV